MRQYAKLLSFDDVELEFTPEALTAIAKKALQRKSGARGLRAIIEDAMLDTMFDLPGMAEINECVITPDSVKGGKPKLIAGVRRRTAKRTEQRTDSTDAS